MGGKKQVGLRAAISLLDCFSTDKPELRLSEISERSGYPVANTLRYLKALEEADLVRKDRGTKKYSLGYKVCKLFHVFSNSVSLLKAALPYMQELNESSNETVCLHVVNKNQGICVERLLNMNALVHNPEVGIGLPLYAGAARKVLLAFMPEDRIKEIIGQGLEKMTDHTITDPDVLVEDLKEIKRRGYAVSSGEQNPGVKSIAVPIWNHEAVVGSLSISGPAIRIKEENEKDFLLQLQKASRSISINMGVWSM